MRDVSCGRKLLHCVLASSVHSIDSQVMDPVEVPWQKDGAAQLLSPHWGGGGAAGGGARGEVDNGVAGGCLSVGVYSTIGVNLSKICS